MEKFRTIYYEKYFSTFKKYLIQDDFEGAIQKSKQWFNKKYLPILKQYPSHSNILDLGCGMGIMLDFLRDNKYKNIEGVEVSNEQFEIAKKRGHKVYLEDAFNYLKKGKKYDVILAMDFFEHFYKDELLNLCELLFESLNEGGCLIIQTPNGEGLMPNRVIYGDLTHLTIFTPNSLTQILRLTGFNEFTFFEAGPAAINIAGFVRLVLWKIIKVGANFIRVVEKNQSQKIWTQDFICAAYKKGIISE